MNTWESMKIGFNRFGMLSTYVMGVISPLIVGFLMVFALWDAWDGEWREAGKLTLIAMGYAWMTYLAWHAVLRERRKDES